MIENTGYQIRELMPHESHLLENFLYHAIFRKAGEPPLPKAIVHEPPLKIYFEDFGGCDDHCLVAELHGEVVGAVWARILAGEIKGYGNVDDRTPEIAISVLKAHRSRGIGTGLMRAMIHLLKARGYAQTSLSVEKANYACKLYTSLGFVTLREQDNDYLMVLALR